MLNTHLPFLAYHSSPRVDDGPHSRYSRLVAGAFLFYSARPSRLYCGEGTFAYGADLTLALSPSHSRLRSLAFARLPSLSRLPSLVRSSRHACLNGCTCELPHGRVGSWRMGSWARERADRPRCTRLSEPTRETFGRLADHPHFKVLRRFRRSKPDQKLSTGNRA